MLDKIKEILKRQPELSCYMVAKILGVDTRSMSVAKNYWKARALLMEELTGKTMETILENTGHYQEGIPNQWTDKEGQVYVKDSQSGIWRVFPYGLEFGTGDVIDERRVKARYAVEMLNR